MRKDDPRYEALQRNKADARSELAELKAHVSFQVVDRHAGDGPVVPITFPTRPEANEWITQQGAEDRYFVQEETPDRSEDR